MPARLHQKLTSVHLFNEHYTSTITSTSRPLAALYKLRQCRARRLLALRFFSHWKCAPCFARQPFPGLPPPLRRFDASGAF